jgi:sigma-B regulation protein RsbU (phosphoserine phosphatase)
MHVLEIKHREEAEKERIEGELAMASRIQSGMLPHEFPPFPDRKEFDIFASMEPAKEIGGDFYDYFFVDDDHLCVVMADVSGKGVPAALFMMVSKAIFQSVGGMCSSAADIMTKANELICSNNQEEMFVTVWIGVLEISTGKLKAANAGHEYPAVKHSDGSFELLKDKHGVVIGAMEGAVYHDYEINLRPGDKVFVYTDGVPEAANSENEMFGTDRMIEALNAAPDASPEEMTGNVRSEVETFAGDAEQFDDITMLALEYKGS